MNGGDIWGNVRLDVWKEGEYLDPHAGIGVSTCSGYNVFHPG